jgi:hypothetical protein
LHAWPSSPLAGFSLDDFYLKQSQCQQLEGNKTACEDAGCESVIPQWNDEKHWCNAYSHHGIKSKSTAMKAAEQFLSIAVDTAQEAVDTACATSETSAACTDAKKILNDATNALDKSLDALENENDDQHDSATGVMASLVVVGLSAVAAFF